MWTPPGHRGGTIGGGGGGVGGPGSYIYIYIHTWHDMTWHDMTWHDMTWHDMTKHDMKWNDMTWHDITYIQAFGLELLKTNTEPIYLAIPRAWRLGHRCLQRRKPNEDRQPQQGPADAWTKDPKTISPTIEKTLRPRKHRKCATWCRGKNNNQHQQGPQKLQLTDLIPEENAAKCGMSLSWAVESIGTIGLVVKDSNVNWKTMVILEIWGAILEEFGSAVGHIPIDASGP